MSTCYRTIPEITIADVTKIPDLCVVTVADNALALSRDDGANVLWAYVSDSIVTGYVRYGNNSVGPIFDAICDQRIVLILSEHDDEFFTGIGDYGLDYSPGDDIDA